MKLAVQLLDCPGGDVACDIRNASDLTPAEIAEKAGHTDLSHVLSGYMEMNEITSAYSRLKEMSQAMGKKASGEDEEGYLTPNDIGVYKICPPPRPVSPKNEAAEGYLSMNQHAPAQGDTKW